MLNTDNRQLLLSCLRPPLGYQFDRGIGTTFTLDLLSLLVTPLALALVDFDSLDEALNEPLVLLESLRRIASRLTIFCQAGYIALPARQNLLFSYLEQRVVEVQAPRSGGVFHPKVWLLRFVREGQPPYYRLLNLTRNLTFDHSWDLALQLEGEVDTSRQKGITSNRPLVDFITTLPQLRLRAMLPEIEADIALLSDEIRKVRWQPPAPFDDAISFHPSGVPGYGTPKLVNQHERILVVSPFLHDSLLQRLAEKSNQNILISRLDSLDALEEETRRCFTSIYSLDDSIHEPSQDIFIEEVPGNHIAESELSGLHAKLFVWEHGRNAGWWVGSANATEAAFQGYNVEFMVELQGKRNEIGIDKVLGDDKDDYALQRLLQPYKPPAEISVPDADAEKADTLAEKVVHWLSRIPFQLSVQKLETGEYALQLFGEEEGRKPDGEYTLSCWPITLMEANAQPIQQESATIQALFSPLSLMAITGFIAFGVTVRVGKTRLLKHFVLNLPIEGLPDGRDEQIVSHIIANREQFMRYLRLLLAQDASASNGDISIGMDLGRLASLKIGGSLSDEVPLLENLVRTVSRAPEKIERIAELIHDLQRTPNGQEIIPTEFLTLWQVIQQWQEQYHER